MASTRQSSPLLRKHRIVCCILCLFPAFAVGAKGAITNLLAEIDRSDFILIGRAESARQVGNSVVNVAGREFNATVLEFDVNVERVLKGTDVPNRIVVTIVHPISAAGSLGYKSVPVGKHRIFLLRKKRASFELSNVRLGTLPAGPEAAKSSGSSRTDEAVADELTRVLSYSEVSQEDALDAIYSLCALDNVVAENALRTQRNSSDVRMRLSALTCLLNRGDTSSMQLATETITAPPAGTPSYLIENLTSAIGRGIKDPAAIPELSKLLNLPNISARRSAAFALRNTASPRALPALAKALNDSDQDVRYFAVIGLAEITGDASWRPLMDDYRSDENKYLAHWRAWSAGLRHEIQQQ